MEHQSTLTSFQKQIYPILNEKETEELLQIWQANDRGEWSEDAFVVIRAILLERQGQVPEQEAPKNAASDLESGYLSQQNNAPARIVAWSNWLSTAVLVIGILLGILRFFALLNSPEFFSFMLGILSLAEDVLLAGAAFLLLQGLATLITRDYERKS